MDERDAGDAGWPDPPAVSRRAFLRRAALIIAAAPAAGIVASCAAPAPAPTQAAASTGASATSLPIAQRPAPTLVRTATPPPPFELLEATIGDAQAAMQAGQLSAHELVQQYLTQIAALDQAGPQLRSILEVNPDALAIAHTLDAERQAGRVRGALHGIPILLKDNIDTADRQHTTAGSLALLGSQPAADATVVQRLRDAGAILLGKTNLSEWANFRSTHSSSGWSARGGQGKNPYNTAHNPCGSSSGSASAVAANFALVALGTETDGSIVCPAHANGVVGLKPTVGLTSRAGVIPISHTQDSVGVLARTVRDAAILLGALVGVDARDPATQASAGNLVGDYTQFLRPDGLRGARIGVARASYFGYSKEADAVAEAALRTLRAQGAVIVDPADIPTANLIAGDGSELTVMLYEFKHDLAVYLATRVPDSRQRDIPIMRTLADLIAFNDAHKAEEMPYFGQELFLQAEQKHDLTSPGYRRALETSRRIAREKGIDAVMDRFKLDALVAPTAQPAWPIDLAHGDQVTGGSSSAAARAGYPLITVPAGDAGGLPIGITFMGRAWSEPVLLRLAYAFEQATKARRPPNLPTVR
jgi:amidase